jgi:3-dehydroquinate dehydratase / shikimate dehydrogenase
MAKICLVLTAATIKENLEIIRRNRNMIDLVELRTDLLDENQYENVSRFPGLTDIPVILTCRKELDGGRWISDENTRTEYLSRWLDGKFSFIDLEMDLVAPELVAKARSAGTEIIRSFHDFQGVPENLYEKMRYSSEENVIVKGAVYPRSSEDLYRLIQTALDLKSDCTNSFILLGMGDFGFPTRILAEKLGSYLTFCSDSAVTSGAPGHCSAADLNDIYNFREISERTVINSIIGNPVSQSRSPQIHNRGYRKNKIDAVYVPFLTDSLRWFMKTSELLKINGSSVTVPFKSEIIPLTDFPDRAVKQIGASNTIFRDSEGKWNSTNTDSYGLIKPLLDFLKIETLDEWKVSVIGAGGAARAAVFALQENGADVAVFNRTLIKGEELAGEFGCSAYPLDKSSVKKLREHGSVIIQTTNAGMPPLENINPLDFYDFDGSEVVYDIIYKPEITILMSKAQESGCRTLGGYRMLEEQAHLQFRLFTGVDF